MPQTFDVEGVGTLEFPDDAKPEEVQKFLDENYNHPKTSAGGALLRSAGASVIPSLASAAGAAALTAESTPFAHAAPPWSELAAAVIGALIGGTAAAIGQKSAIKKYAPQLRKLQEADVQQHGVASSVGGFAGALPTFEFNPFGTIRGLAALPKIYQGTASLAQREAAMGAATQIGMGAATGVVSPLMEGEKPTASGIGESILTTSLLGNPRLKMLRGKMPAPQQARPPLTREEQANYYQYVQKKVAEGGRKLNQLQGDIPGFPQDVFHAREDGSVDVSLPKLDLYLSQYIDPRQSREEAIDRAITEELTHAAQYDLPQAKEKAAEYWNDYTPLEKWAMRKIIMGERPKNPQAAQAYDARAKNDTYLGLESSRYWMQRMSDIGPSEMSALQAQGSTTVKSMDRLLAFVRWLREAFGTKASKSQNEYFERVTANANLAKKGAIDAQRVHQDKGQPAAAGQEPQGGQADRSRDVQQAPPGQPQPVAQGAQVLLAAKELHEKQNEVIAGLQPGEYVKRSAVSTGGFLRQVFYGPHHPGILKDMGGEELAKSYEARESRENDMFGFETNLRKWVPRSALTVRKTGKPAHSDDIPLFGQKTVAEQPKQPTSPRDVTAVPIKNPELAELVKARTAVAALEKAVATDPSLAPELEKARGILAEAQKAFEAARKVSAKGPPVTTPQGEPRSQAPEGMPTTGGAPTPPVPGAISEAKPEPEKAQGQAEQAWRDHDEQLRLKLKAGEEMNREDRLKARELWKAALAENPELGTEGAGVTMKGRAVPPYTEQEALEISMGIFPDMPPKSLEPMVKEIVGMDPKDQDAFVNHLRGQVIMKQIHDAEMARRSHQATTQERIEAGTQRRLPIPEKSMAQLKLALHQYFKDTVGPVFRGGQLTAEKVGTTYGGKTKITLPTVGPAGGKAQLGGTPRSMKKVSFQVPSPMDWLRDMVREPPVTLPIKPDPYVVQASDRQLLQIYDETWAAYLHNAPSEDLVKLRQAHNLDRLDLRGDIPEPELDPLIRIFQAVRHGEPILPGQPGTPEEKLLAMANTRGIDTTKKGWEDALLENLRSAVEERLPEIALARGIDISVGGWQKKLLGGLLREERKLGRARAEYIAPAGGSVAKINRLGREFNAARDALTRKRSRLERMLQQRGSSDMFIGQKSPARTRITLDDIHIKSYGQGGHGEVGPYAQFMLIKDIDDNALDYLGHGTKIGEDVEHVYEPQDLKEFNHALVEGEGGVGANATKRVTLLYNTKTGDLDAVSTYWNDKTKKAMLYDPTGEPGKRDRDHLRIPQLPGRYRIFGTMLVRDPLGYFHQRWSSDDTGSGLKKFWLEIGEVANGAAEGTTVWRRISRVREAREERAARKELIRRTELSEKEQRAKGRLEELYADMAEKDEDAQKGIDKAEQQEWNEAHQDTKETLGDEGKAQEDGEEFSAKELASYEKRFERLAEMTEAGDIEDIEIGPKVNKMDRAALQEFEKAQRRGMVEQAQSNLMGHDISHQEARDLAYLFYRFNINTESRASFKKSMETVLGYLHDSLAQQVSGRNFSLLSAMKKIAAVHYNRILKGKGLAEELKWYIEDHPKLSKEAATKKFYVEKQQKAFEYALEAIREIHIDTRAELDQLPRRAARVQYSQSTPDYPLFPDRFAWRVTETFGDDAARYLEALSVSPKRAAERAVRDITDGGKLHQLNLPAWVISRDPKTAAARAKWFKTGEGLSWLRSPEGQDFLRRAGAAVVASKRITDRLVAAKGLSREMMGQTGKGKIPTGKLPEPVEAKYPPPSTHLSPEDQKLLLEQSSKAGRARSPAVVGSQLAARTDMHNVATELGDLENRIAVPGMPEENWPTLRHWLTSPEGKRYLLERWGIQQKPKESVVDLHDRLSRKLDNAVQIEERLRGREEPPGPWAKVDPGIELERTTPGLTMKEHVAGRKRREAQSAALGLPPPTKPEDSLTQEELLALGPDKYAQGGKNSNPYQVRERIERTGGQISTSDASLLLWWDRQLQKDADKLAEDPKFGKNSPEYQAAEKDWLEWRDWEQNRSGRSASEQMRLRQGVQDLETGSWVAMKSELRRATRGQATDADEAVLAGMVGEQHENEEAIQHAEEGLKGAKVEREKTDPLSMPVGKEQQQAIQAGADYIAEFVKQAKDGWTRDSGSSMAMKAGAKVAPLTEQERNSLIAIGLGKMSELSAVDGLSEGAWRKAMIKDYPNSAPFLGEIWAPARKLRDVLVAKAVGADKSTEIARRVLTRELPTPEESKAVLAKAMAANPGMRNISTAEAVHAWNFIKQKYFDQMTGLTKEGDFDAVLTMAAIDLGMPRERLYRALIAKKSIRTITNELYRRMDKANRMRSHIRAWIDAKEHPWLVNVAKAVPRVMFMDKIFGHGFVGMITHASDLAFQPWAWKSYFGKNGGWQTMYEMVLSDTWLGKKIMGDASVGLHQRYMKAIETDDLYRFAKRMGLEIDPYRFHADYEAGRLYSWMRDKTHGRGFDALKKLRLDLFKTWWGTLEPHLQTEQMGRLIANDINHMTGIVHSRFPGWASNTFFAPKLAASQWGVLVTDPLKAMGYLSHWKTSSPEQRAWAMGQLKHKAAMVGVYFAGLALNQGFLKAFGYKQDINAPLVGAKSDPSKSDFMAFKVGGFDVGLASPMIQIVRLLSDMIHIGLGKQSHLEATRTRGGRGLERLGEYARRKFSPFAGAAFDAWSGQDFTGRPLPWSSDVLPLSRRMRGVRPYTWTEYGLHTVSPIPVEEAVREVWRGMGMNTSTATRLWKALVVSVPTAFTGARVWEDPYAESGAHASRQPVGAY